MEYKHRADVTRLRFLHLEYANPSPRSRGNLVRSQPGSSISRYQLLVRTEIGERAEEGALHDLHITSLLYTLIINHWKYEKLKLSLIGNLLDRSHCPKGKHPSPLRRRINAPIE